jgi:glycosyltransferase involved in cell wall biosynthesis
VARKNPMATLQAFKQAFQPNDNTVGLVLKTMNTKPNNPEWQAFIKECQTDNRIQIITETLDRSEVLGLINACDAYVSLHRAEGFGRTLAEAMLLGKPVIATNYSGNVDFMQNELAYPVNFELVNVEQNSYQWVSNEDSAKWATASLLESIHSFKKVSKAKLDKVDREKINLLFSSEVLSVIFSSSII